MCGINGILSFDNEREGSDLSSLVENMNDLVSHRGPDDEGVWSNISGNVCLGHRRLSILDLSTNGHQPMTKDGITIVFNGEIYNFEKLKLSIKNYRFVTNTDTELLLALYIEKGKNLLQEIEGMFAFAIWDSHKKGMFLARDRIGKKPLYYNNFDGLFSFSSEVRSLLSLPWQDSKLDEQALNYFLTFGFTPPPLTMFSKIFKLEQGKYLWVDSNGNVDESTYWKPLFSQTPGSESGLVNKIRDSIGQSMKLRMVSDTPIGIFLSGGVDSTAVATLMKEETSEKIKSFSIGFKGMPDHDETQDARKTADRLGFDHFEKIVSKNDMKSMIKEVIEIFDEPLADPTSIPIYFLTKMAKEEGVKVILTGDGPDELFLGYHRWSKYVKAYPWYNIYKALPFFIKSPVYNFLKTHIKSQRFSELIYRGTYNQELFWGRAPSFKEGTKRRMLTDSFIDRNNNTSCSDYIENLRYEYNSLTKKTISSDGNWMAFIGLRFAIPNYYMHRADKLGMWNSVELRAPFLDSDFVNLALSIQPRWKVRNKHSKYIFKRSLEGVVPHDILYKKKMGFSVPLAEWGGDIMIDYIDQNLDAFCQDYDIFNKLEVNEIVNNFKNGDLALVNNVWNIYYLIAWINRWISK